LYQLSAEAGDIFEAFYDEMNELVVEPPDSRLIGTLNKAPVGYI